jgi:hypothetical protein
MSYSDCHYYEFINLFFSTQNPTLHLVTPTTPYSSISSQLLSPSILSYSTFTEYQITISTYDSCHVDLEYYFMKYTYRRNYQSSSYNSPKFILENGSSSKERDAYSVSYNKRKNRLLRPSEENIETKFSQAYDSRRFRSKGSVFKTAYHYEMFSKIRT